MKKDWSQKALWTGFVVSLVALTLHSSGALSMDGLNPMAVSGCASHELVFQRPLPPDGGVSAADVTFIKGERRTGKTLARGTKIYVHDHTGRVGPLLSYGVDYKRRLFFASTAIGELIAFPFDELKKIRVVRKSAANVGAGWGALVGGVLGLVIGGSQDSGGLPALCGAFIGVPAGTAVGAVGGALAGVDDNYRFGPDKWRIYVPTPKTPAEPKSEPVPVKKAAPKVEAKPAEGSEEKPVSAPDAETPKADAPTSPEGDKKD